MAEHESNGEGAPVPEDEGADTRRLVEDASCALALRADLAVAIAMLLQGRLYAELKVRA
ncbi:MAG: hypothetical protein KUG77_25765 [Nannocystaceae bacterium]|nr:hypothetical protein [Nannocystaceae bacterium]